MKKLILLCFCIAIATTSLFAEGRVVTITPAFVNISTSGVIISGIRANRKYYNVVNMDDDTNVYIASYPVTGATYATVGSFVVPANYGNWEDNYYVASSSWYATTGGVSVSTAVVCIMEKE